MAGRVHEEARCTYVLKSVHAPINEESVRALVQTVVATEKNPSQLDRSVFLESPSW